MFIVINKKWQAFLDYSMIILGCVIMGASFSIFLEPNQITTGGFSGLAMMINSLFVKMGITFLSSSIIYFALNIILFILAFKQLGKRFAFRAFVGIAVFSISMELFTFVKLPYEYDNIISAIFGGLLNGIGVGLVVRFGGSTGGSDMIASMLKKKHPYFQIGKITTFIDILVVLMSLVVYNNGLELLPYTIIALAIYCISTDFVNEGYKQVKAYTIITTRPEEVSQVLMSKTLRGVTMTQSKGMYSHQDRATLVCLISKQQVGMMRRLIKATDPTAFVYSTAVSEVIGYWTPEKDMSYKNQENAHAKHTKKETTSTTTSAIETVKEESVKNDGTKDA